MCTSLYYVPKAGHGVHAYKSVGYGARPTYACDIRVFTLVCNMPMPAARPPYAEHTLSTILAHWVPLPAAGAPAIMTFRVAST